MRNVELKALDPDPERTLAAALALDGVRDEGVLLQRDTYFAGTREGRRLKLREERPEGARGPRATLIPYARPDLPDVRVSDYALVPVPDTDALCEALTAALGVRVVVVKRRRLLLWRGVRIHLDEVEGLGRFLELEAVAPAGSDLRAEHARIAELRTALAVADAALREGSYADALLARAPA